MDGQPPLQKYGLTGSEIAFIEAIVRPMDITGDLFEDISAENGDDE